MKTYEEYDDDFSEVVGSEKLREEFYQVITFIMSGHTRRTIGGLAIVFLIGGAQALHGNGTIGSWVDMVIPLLLVLEHAVAGKTE